MPETTESEAQPEAEAQPECKNVINELYDAMRYLGDASYAILPEELAHNLGDLKKSFLSTIRSLIEKDIEWVEARVAGGDRLRQEWQAKYGENSETASEPEPVN